jgi:hypothetical protein
VNTNGLVTVVTPTLGDSAGHLNRRMIDMRLFTDLPFREIVSDDGTLDVDQRLRQCKVTEGHGALWTENPGPLWGVSYNLDHAFSLVETPWAFLIEDGVRPGLGWLETAIDAVERIGSRTWEGHPVGMMAADDIEDWHLALAGALPNCPPWREVHCHGSAETYSAFWGSARHENWNDGLWCWKRIWGPVVAAAMSPEADGWPEGCDNFRDVVRSCVREQSAGTPEPLPPYYRNRLWDCWPEVRVGGLAWFPGPFLLVNMDAWRRVGRWAPGCTFFEGHLGVRMALGGYLSIRLKTPPFLHYIGMGFRNAGHQGKTPRHHEPCDGPGGILERDFGVNGPAHRDLYALVQKVFPSALCARVDSQLKEVPLWMHPAWEKWL